MLAEVVSWTGNAASRSISHSGGGDGNTSPDLVIIKGDNASYTVWRSSAHGATDIAHSMFIAYGAAAGLITAFSGTTFSIGTGAPVNASGVAYQALVLWENGDGDLAVGTYVGNGSDNRTLSGVMGEQIVAMFGNARGGFESKTNEGGAFRGSHAGDLTSIYGYNDIADCYQELQADGDVVLGAGSGNFVNVNGKTYDYFAFGTSASTVSVGDYAGTETDDRDIAHGCGRTPAYGFTGMAIFSTSGSRHSTHAGDNSNKENSAVGANRIQAWDASNFQIGTEDPIQYSTAQHYWFMLAIPPQAYSVSVAETATATDAPGGVASMSVAVAEAAVATDSPGGVASFGVSVAEAASATDTLAHPVDGPIIEQEFSGAGSGWTSTRDDLRFPVSLRWGIPGSGPLDRVAASGVAGWSYDNSALNSGGLVGYYSWLHANKRSGFALGTRVRLGFMRGGLARIKHYGWLDRAVPQPGPFRPRVECSSSDWIDQAARRAVMGVATRVGGTADQAISDLISSVPVAPIAQSLDTGTDTLAYALDGIQAGAGALGELARVVFTEWGYLYVKGNGTVRFEDRDVRSTGAPAVTLTADDLDELLVDHGREQIRNLVRVRRAPRVATSAGVTLARMQTDLPIAAGATILVTLKYVDPNQTAARVGGTSMTSPVANTDFKMYTATGGGGSDITADLTVTPDFGGDQVQLSLTNANASLGYIRGGTTDSLHLTVRGTGLLSYDEDAIEAKDQTSIDTYGEQALELVMPYQNSATVAKAIADNLLAAWKDPGQAVVARFRAERSDDLFQAFLDVDIGSMVAIVEATTGINEAFWVQSIEVEMPNPYTTWVTWHMTRAATGVYWKLGDAGYSELGETTVVAPL